MAQRHGYLIVDHRASPGLTLEQARMNGYDPGLSSEGKVFEADTLTCSHCRVVVVKNPLRMRERVHCVKCDHYICDACGFKAAQSGYVHKPFEAKMVEAFAQQPEILTPLTIR